MTQGIEIEVMGHKGKITRLLPTVSQSSYTDPCMHEVDTISAVVEFDPPVDGTMGLYVNIPAKDYTRHKLVAAVIRKVEASFEWDRKVKEARARRETREKALEALVDRVKKAVGL